MKELAVFTQAYGVPTQTCMLRHIRDVLPGRTVAITTVDCSKQHGAWSVDCPVLRINYTDYMRSAPAAVSAIAAFLKEHQSRVLLGEMLDLSLPLFTPAREAGVRLFGHAHGRDVYAAGKYLAAAKASYSAYNSAAGVFAVSEHMRAALIADGINPALITVKPCAVDVPPEPAERPDTDIIRCIAVGRVIDVKAPILMLDAFRRAAEQVKRPLHLDYYGDGDLLPAVKQFVRAFDLQEKVTLHGVQPQATVLKALRRADIFIQHGISDAATGLESRPTTVAEAMAAALPVIAPRVGGVPESVSDGVTGFLVRPGDNKDMAERIVTLSKHPDLRLTMGRAGWERARAELSFERERETMLRTCGLKSEQPHESSRLI